MSVVNTVSNTFSSSVADANEHFAKACEHSGAVVEQFNHPLSDPQGRPLQTSVAWLGPKEAEHVLMIVSGTHGAEGWAGSAIQIDALEQGVFQSLPADTALMMIHLINPWGCAWGRRENEDNADLFRDFIYYKPELRSDDILFDDALAEALTLTCYTDEARSQSETKIEQVISAIGERSFTEITRAGQFRYPQTPCYNGGGISWSYRLYRDLVSQYLNKARRVFCLDLHTAFGDYGDGILIPYYAVGGPDQPKLDALASYYGKDRCHIAGFDSRIPSHPRLPYEIAMDFIPGLEMLSTVLEFGTYDWVDGVNLIKYMNYLFTEGDPLNPECPDLVDQYNKLCYPDKDDWRDMVIARSREVIQQTLAGIESWSNNP